MFKSSFLSCCGLVLMSQVGMAADSHSLPATSVKPDTVATSQPNRTSSEGIRVIYPKKGSQQDMEKIRELLQSYNYLAESDHEGRLKKLIVSSTKSTSAMPLTSSPKRSENDLLHYLPRAFSVPEIYRNHSPAAVSRINLSSKRLDRMAKGSRMQLNLPDGKNYTLVHDATRRNTNGVTTWMGHLDTESGLNRTLLSFDRNGAEGQIMTPEGVYRIESHADETFLINMAESGLEAGNLYADESLPKSASVRVLRGGGMVRYKRADETEYAARATLSPSGLAIIDVVVAYTKSLAGNDFQRKLNLLIALANQAFLDSKVDISLRLVGTQAVDYLDESANTAALDDLTHNVGGLRMLQGLKQQKAADAVVLLRSFVPDTQGGCGTAWVNGSDGSSMNPEHAYAVVSLGAGGGQYCSHYALAHEVGHLLGATHDPEHSTVQGRFPYSYGYGLEGRFGDIMSYYSPEIGLYANPNLNACTGQPCGIPDQSDLARTFNVTGKTVSGFTVSR